MQLKPINQQVVAVVGASRGIGRECALQFAKRGDYSNMVIPSVTDWLAKNPALQWGAIAGVMALALLATQSFNNEK